MPSSTSTSDRRCGRRLRAIAAGAIGGILAAELLCRVLPVSTATFTDYYTDPSLLTYPAHHIWEVATGWDLRNAQRLRSNNAGFAARRDFAEDATAVALIGDSYVEASMLDEPARPEAQLEQALKGTRPVYAMGSPGTSLLDYAERVRVAAERYGVRDFVLLMERGDVRQSLCGSGNYHAPCLDPRTLEARTERRVPAGWAKRALRHSALAQYLFGQLKLDPARLLSSLVDQWRPGASAFRASVARADFPASQAPIAQVDAVTSTFFERIRPYRHGHLVIVVDGDREAIEAHRRTDDAGRDRFIELARKAGAIVVDADPLYRSHAARCALRLEVGPYDGHLNALGVAIVMRAAARALGAVPDPWRPSWGDWPAGCGPA